MNQLRIAGMLTFAIAIVMLSACAKRTLTYEEALPLFKKGMTMQEAVAAYGETGVKVQLGEFMSWTYTPIERLKPPLTEIHGFTVFFRDGSADHIDMNTTTVR